MSAMKTTAAKGRYTAQQGFTLIELVIVLAVLGALAAIAVPQLTGFQGDAELNGTATAIASEANNAFANDLVSGDMAGGGTADWTATVCDSVDGNTDIPSASTGDFTLSNTSTDGSVEVTLPAYDTSTEKVSETTCHLAPASP